MKHAKKTNGLLCALGLLLPVSSHGSLITVDFTAFGGQRDVILENGSPVPDGNEVRLGTFDPGFDLFANSGDLLALDGAFNLFGSTSIDSGTTGTAGGFTGTASQMDPSFDNERIYLWIFDTTDDAPPTAAYDNVAEHGIFTNDSLADWVIPAVGATIPSTMVTSSDVTIGASTVLPGSLQLGSVNAATAVPEASEVILVAMMVGGCCLARRRRRGTQQRPTAGVVPPAALLAAGAIVLAMPAARAVTTINYVGQLGHRNVIDEAGDLIPNQGGEVRVGVLAENFDLATHANDLQRVREAFRTLGKTPIRTVQNEPSRFSADTSFEKPGLAGKKLYLWVIKTTNGEAVASDYSNVAEHALYSSSSSGWVVPPDTKQGALPPANRAIINSSEINEQWGRAKVQDDSAPGSLQIASVKSPDLGYAAFAAATFPDDAPVWLTGPEADYDNDGLPNALELFTGNNPLLIDASPFTFSVDEDGRYLFTFNRAETVDAGVGSVQFSEDLLQWYHAEPEVSILSREGGVERVQAVFHRHGFERFFLRLVTAEE